MKKPTADADTMRDEYDFTGGVRGKYAKRFAKGSNVVVLDPDVAEAFKNSTAVNDALREVLRTRKGGRKRKAG
jgi:hypothetical protein